MEAGGRKMEAKECGCPLQAENRPVLTASKEKGSQVQQSQGAEFCQ